MSRYLVMNIGCIECGISSNVVGRYKTKIEADAVAEVLNEKLYWRDGGQNSFEVFDLRQKQSDEYAQALA